MTNLETNLLEVLTHEAIRFCGRAIWLFPAPSCKCIRPLYGTFINGFAKKALAGVYGLYDKVRYVLTTTFVQTKINPFHGLMLLPKPYGKERKVLVFAKVRGR